MRSTELARLFELKADSLASDNKEPTAKFRSDSYRKVAKLIRKKSTDVVDVDYIDTLDITDHMREKAIEYVKLNQLELKKILSSDTLYNKLLRISGVGPYKAKKLIERGVQSIEDLDKPEYFDTLSNETKLYLKYKPSESIPREDVEDLEDYLGTLNLQSRIVIAGSYRRRVEVIHDIDVLIVTKEEDGLERFLKAIKKKYTVVVCSLGKEKMSTLILLNKTVGYVRLDCFQVKPKYSVAMLLYLTGSKEHNVKMRHIAKKKGYVLNQLGCYRNGKRLIGLRSERDYFDLLNIQYKDPWERF